MIIIKNNADIEGMRASGHIAAEVRELVARKITPGIFVSDLSDYAGELIKKFGAESAFLGYRGFPGQICISVNESVVHGIPCERRIEIGDIVSIDIGVRYRGYIGDTAKTVMVGVVDREVIKLVKVTEKALDCGIAKALAGGRLSDISYTIEQTVENKGFSVVREFVGHGIGRELHEDPQIPNFGKPGRGPGLKRGMTLAIEPMVNMGQPEVEVKDDGWTVVTVDRKMSAHFEHTIVILDGEPEILTL